MTDSHQLMRTVVFRETAARIRRNGGHINKKALRAFAFNRLWNDRWNADITPREATALANDIVGCLAISFDMSKYRTPVSRTAPEREQRWREIVEYHTEQKRQGTPKSVREIAREFSASKSTVHRALAKFGERSDDAETAPILASVLELLVPSDGRRLLLANTLEERLSLEFGGVGGPHLENAILELQESEWASKMGLVEVDADRDFGKMFVAHRGRSRSEAELRKWAGTTIAARLQQRAPHRLSQLRYAPLHSIASTSGSEALSVAVAVLAVSEDMEDIHVWLTMLDAFGQTFADGAPLMYDKVLLRNRIAGAFRQGHRQGLESVSALVASIGHKETKELCATGVEFIMKLQEMDRPDLMLRVFDHETSFSDRLGTAEADRWHSILAWLEAVEKSPYDALLTLARRDALRFVEVSSAIVEPAFNTRQVLEVVLPLAFGGADEREQDDYDEPDENCDDVVDHQFSAAGYSPLLDEEGFIYGPEENDDD